MTIAKFSRGVSQAEPLAAAGPSPRKHEATGADEPSSVIATLRPYCVGGDKYGYLYDVVVDGETIVRRSHAPEHDACRALLAKGITGRLTLMDMSGTPRSSLDIEKAAPWTVIEDDKRGLLVVRYREWPGSAAVASPGLETDPPGTGVPPGPNTAQEKRPLQQKEHSAGRRETDAAYPHVVLCIGDDWRIIGCREDIQWIVQSRSGMGWRTHGYSHTRGGVRAMLSRNGLNPAAADSLPTSYPEGRRAALGQPTAGSLVRARRGVEAPPLAPEMPDEEDGSPQRRTAPPAVEQKIAGRNRS